jgi:hypothetical protein
MGVWMTALGVIGIVASVIVVIMVCVAGLRTRMTILGGTGLACIVGSVIGLLAVYIAIDHNPQEEFVKQATDEVNYLGLSEIFLSWFVIVSLAVALALALGAFRGLRILYRRVRRADRRP